MDMLLLEDCCDILDSQRVPITAADRAKGEYPYYGANGIQDYVADYIFDDELVLLAEDGGNFGSKERPIAYKVSGKCWVNNHAHVLKPKAEIDVDYLCYSLMFYNTDGLVNGATRQKLTQATMRKMLIPKRSLEEQKTIVNKLAITQSIITHRKQQLLKLDELVKARFVEMFGTMPSNEKEWKVRKIRDIVSDVRYGSSRKAAEGNSGKYPYLRMNNITYGGELDLSDTKTIDIPENELSKCSVKRGDVLFNRTNSRELVGKTCVYNRDELMVLAGFIIRVRVNEMVIPEFLSSFLNTDFSKRMLFDMCKEAIGQANINAQELQNISIYIPPIELQNQFATFAEKINKSKFLNENVTRLLRRVKLYDQF
ncbi:MAG: restriction endonuclease subunit S [Oscillospiraceae bacterium]